MRRQPVLGGGQDVVGNDLLLRGRGEVAQQFEKRLGLLITEDQEIRLLLAAVAFGADEGFAFERILVAEGGAVLGDDVRPSTSSGCPRLPSIGSYALILRAWPVSAKPSCNYGGVINRIGTGEVPDAGIGGFVAVLLHPATFSTVTSRLPLRLA